MKCVCGYEQEKDFPNYEHHEKIAPNMARVVRFTSMFVCPVCGTLRVKLEEADHE